MFRVIGTSPKGVFIVDIEKCKVIWVLEGNFFGIDIKDCIIYLAERIQYGTLLHMYTLNFKEISKIYIKEVEDVHQISVSKKYDIIFLTDTSRNRVVCLHSKNTKQIISVNKDITKDINHVNAVLFDDYDETLYIGLNNKGLKESQILYDTTLVTLPNLYHSHDICIYNYDFLISASHDSYIYSFNSKKPLFYVPNSWTRGLCISNNYIIVGASAVSPRSSRQDSTLKNSINLFSHDDFKHIKQIEIPRAGQINDLLCIKE